MHSNIQWRRENISIKYLNILEREDNHQILFIFLYMLCAWVFWNVQIQNTLTDTFLYILGYPKFFLVA